jgi:hypothetical protein
LKLGRKTIIAGLAAVTVAAASPAVYFFALPLIGLGEHPAKEHGQGDQSSQHGSGSKDGHGPDAPKQADAAVEEALAYTEPQTRKSPIVLAARNIADFQTAMANGDGGASAKLKKAMLAFPDLAKKRDPKQMSSSDIEAVAQYVFSGGDPVVAKELLTRELDDRNRKLLSGAAAFINNAQRPASKDLAALKPEDFNPVLSAHLLMAQAHLLPESKSKEKAEKLMQAASLAPGTLLEEAAARRLVALHGKSGDLNRFVYWTSRYLRRFPQSLYKAEFNRNLFQATDGMLASGKKFPAARLAVLFMALDATEKKELAERLVVSALRRRDEHHCKSLSEVFELRALHLACGDILSSKSAHEELKLIDVTDLAPDSRALVAQAIRLAGEIHERTDVPQMPLGPNLPLSADPEHAEFAASLTQQLKRSMTVLEMAGR